MVVVAHSETVGAGTPQASGLVDYRSPITKARAEGVAHEVISAAIEVHRQLGPGLLESGYLGCLAAELTLRRVAYRLEVPLSITYKGSQLSLGYRIDLLVEDLVVVELKTVERLDPIHQAQLLTYLRLSGRWPGLLINFNTDLIKHGLRRMLNGS